MSWGSPLRQSVALRLTVQADPQRTFLCLLPLQACLHHGRPKVTLVGNGLPFSCSQERNGLNASGKVLRKHKTCLSLRLVLMACPNRWTSTWQFTKIIYTILSHWGKGDTWLAYKERSSNYTGTHWSNCEASHTFHHLLHCFFILLYKNKVVNTPSFATRQTKHPGTILLHNR